MESQLAIGSTSSSPSDNQWNKLCVWGNVCNTIAKKFFSLFSLVGTMSIVIIIYPLKLRNISCFIQGFDSQIYKNSRLIHFPVKELFNCYIITSLKYLLALHRQTLNIDETHLQILVVIFKTMETMIHESYSFVITLPQFLLNIIFFVANYTKDMNII